VFGAAAHKQDVPTLSRLRGAHGFVHRVEATPPDVGDLMVQALLWMGERTTPYEGQGAWYVRIPFSCGGMRGKEPLRWERGGGSGRSVVGPGHLNVISNLPSNTGPATTPCPGPKRRWGNQKGGGEPPVSVVGSSTLPNAFAGSQTTSRSASIYDTLFASKSSKSVIQRADGTNGTFLEPILRGGNDNELKAIASNQM